MIKILKQNIIDNNNNKVITYHLHGNNYCLLRIADNTNILEFKDYLQVGKARIIKTFIA